MPRDPHVILIGLRGCGKSTVGALLAQRLTKPLIDLDERTAARLGTPTAGDALRTHGEPAFRAAEAAALKDALAHDRAVLALGGGTPTAPTAADTLRAARASDVARIIYLHAPPDTLRARLSATDTRTRPALTSAGVLNEVAALYAARDPLYRSLADLVIGIDAITPVQAVDQIAAWLSIETLDPRG